VNALALENNFQVILYEVLSPVTIYFL